MRSAFLRRLPHIDFESFAEVDRLGPFTPRFEPDLGPVAHRTELARRAAVPAPVEHAVSRFSRAVRHRLECTPSDGAAGYLRRQAAGMVLSCGSAPRRVGTICLFSLC